MKKFNYFFLKDICFINYTMPKRQKKKIPNFVFIAKPKGCFDIKTVDGKTTEVEVNVNSFRPDNVRRVIRYDGGLEFDVPRNVHHIVLEDSFLTHT